MTPGNEGTHLMLGKLDGGRTQIVARSFWTSYDAIHGFAGEDIETAGNYPEDGRYLVQREDTAEASRPR